jgi:hypothetical protein
MLREIVMAGALPGLFVFCEISNKSLDLALRAVKMTRFRDSLIKVPEISPTE